MMNNLKIVLISLALISCTKENIRPLPCIGDCGTNYEIIYKNSPILPNSDGYYEIGWDGLNYFQVKGNLTELNEEYIINGVPLIEANFDSDYWVLFDTIQFRTPMYSYLGWFNDQTMNNPIPIGNYTYTLNNLIEIHPPTNVVGYQIPKYFCYECPYAPTIVGAHSKYNYNPTCNVMLSNEMIGDTINIFIETMFNSDLGPRETINNNLKIIIL